MQLQLIRNATMRLTYAGVTILTDPYLAPRHAYPSLRGRSRNPMVDLPPAAADVLKGIDAVITSHLHPDHFDAAARSMIDLATPILCQPADIDRLNEMGYRNQQAVEDRLLWHGITVIRRAGMHGSGNWSDQMGPVSGFVFQADGEPTIYWCGDTIWYQAIRETIDQYRPDIIIAHSGGAEFEDGQPIIMNATQTVDLCHYAPQAQVIAIHLEVDDHCTVTRNDLRAYADRCGIDPFCLLIPADGEIVAF
jgi:L-ascorbate metabolism protein UlaG (beta-lactamase superfamily)